MRIKMRYRRDLGDFDETDEFDAFDEFKDLAGFDEDESYDDDDLDDFEDEDFGGFSRYHPPPRPVANGLRVRGARTDIGDTWWSRRFLDVLESFALGNRLSRGRDYARAGQIVSLDVKPGLVSAQVQGSRPKPYQVTVGLAPFPELVWAKVEVALAEQAIYSARLLAGDLPAELEDVFAAAGAPLFPRAQRELDLACSCPDWEVPCKHIAAACYLLAESFDTDPFQILHWRGRTRDALLDRLRLLRATQPQIEQPAGTGEVARNPIGAAAALADLVDTPAQADRFWFAPVGLPPRQSSTQTVPGLLLRQLAPPTAALGGPRLTQALTAAYDRFAA